MYETQRTMPATALHRRPRRWTAIVLAVALATSSCGTLRYDRAWKSFDAAGAETGMVGRWKGEWRSEWNGHSGGLRCLMTAESDGTYLARFHSTYGRFLSFRHSTVFRVVSDAGGVLSFEGAEDLGSFAGGVYEYRGTVAGDHFEARYEAENGDHGLFMLERARSRENSTTVSDPPPP
jgi:hypothetical protein